MKSATRFLKRLACFTLAAVLALTCLSACGGGGGKDGKAKLKVFFFANDHEKEIFQQIITSSRKPTPMRSPTSNSRSRPRASTPPP